MAFTPINASQPISYAMARTQYRNVSRESAWGTPVFICPPDTPVSDYALYTGPKYQYGYNYYNSPSNIKGNCTWWCWCRLYEAIGTRLPGMGDASSWYDNYTGQKSRNANNANPGDIIVMTDGEAGHVAFIERIVGNVITVSESAYSSRSVWNDMACLVTTYNKSDIVQGNRVDMYKDLDSPYYQTIVGVIHTGEAQPVVHTPEITVTPSSGTITLVNGEGSIDIEILARYIDANDTDPYPSRDQTSGLSREWISDGWQITTYSESGVTYKQTYGKMKIKAVTGAVNPGVVRFYHTFLNGFAEAYGRYNIVEGEDDSLIVILTFYANKKKLKEEVIQLM